MIAQLLLLTQIIGVTITDPWNRETQIAESLQALVFRPTARIVFDEYVKAKEYRRTVKTIEKVADIQGLILDSQYMKEYSIQKFKARVDEYITAFPEIGIWEIGNEVNGEWLGASVQTITKVQYAFEKAKASNKKTALTLYYNDGCWEKKEHEMFAWTKNIPPEIRNGIDYLWISYYEDDCNGKIPNWEEVFQRIGTIFPFASLGIGECGTTRKNKKAEYIRRYYSMTIKHDRFVGGYFWWYYDRDMVPKTKPLWTTLNEETRKHAENNRTSGR